MKFKRGDTVRAKGNDIWGTLAMLVLEDEGTFPIVRCYHPIFGAGGFLAQELTRQRTGNDRKNALAKAAGKLFK